MPKQRNLSTNPEAVASRERRARKKAAGQTVRYAQKTVKETPPALQPTDDQAPDIPLGQLFQAESAPPETYEQGFTDGLWASFKRMVGIEQPLDSDKKKALARPLNKQQLTFVDNVTPILAGGVHKSTGWAWQRVGQHEAYGMCAADMEISTRIVEPLVRIYARTAKFTASLDPNTADLAASLLALGSYVFVSMQMFDLVRARLAEQEEGQHGGNFTHSYENGYGGANGRQPSPSASSDAADQQVQPGTAAFNPGNLSERERASFEALSRLRERDIAARTRRSGQFGLS